MAKTLTIVAMLMLAVSVLFGFIEPGTAVVLSVVGGVLMYAIERKVSAWGVMVLCALSGGAMAVTVPSSTTDWLTLLYTATITWPGWPAVGLGLSATHAIALLWVNVTDTPDDDEAYGRFYKKYIEPAAGIFNGGKAKQQPFSKRWS